jgi:hypothetical protein
MARTMDSRARILQDVTDEAAVDLEHRHRQLPQIGKRGQAGAEVIECDAATEPAQAAHQYFGARDAGDRCVLGQLEAEDGGIQAT